MYSREYVNIYIYIERERDRQTDRERERGTKWNVFINHIHTLLIDVIVLKLIKYLHENGLLIITTKF